MSRDATPNEILASRLKEVHKALPALRACESAIAKLEAQIKRVETRVNKALVVAEGAT